MDVTALIPALFLLTALAVIVFAFVSKARTERRLHDDETQKSTLAADGPNTKN